MKHLTLILVLVLAYSLNSNAQQEKANSQDKTNTPSLETLMKPGTSFGGFVSLNAGFSTNKDGEYAKLGGRLAIVLNRRITLGLGGYGFSSIIEESTNNNGIHVAGGYGGLLIEPTIFPEKLVHISFPILIGAGEAIYNDYRTSASGSIYDFDYYASAGVRDFVFIEPGISAELNVARFMRLGATASYTFDHEVYSNYSGPKNSMNGATFALNIKLGWF